MCFRTELINDYYICVFAWSDAKWFGIKLCEHPYFLVVVFIDIHQEYWILIKTYGSLIRICTRCRLCCKGSPTDKVKEWVAPPQQNPWTSYVNDDGQILYKVKTPFQFKFGLVSTIKSALPDYIPAPGSSKINGPPPYKSTSDNDVKGDVEFDATPDDDVDGDDVGLEDAELRDRFAHLAEIKFNKITSSVMRYRGEEFKTSEFFTKKELGWFGRHRAFTGPDGLEYKWILGFRVPELVRQDAARTPVARFHRRRLGIFGKARQASLEIFPEGMHMVDLILVTFVYAQKIRNDAERASRRQIYTSY